MSAHALHRWRERWRWLHLVLGLGAGLLLALLGLSGSLLVYYTELDGLLAPPLRAVASQGTVTAWEPVLQALERAHPERRQGWRLELPPAGEQGLVTARYLKPAERSGAFFAPLLVSVDTARLAVVDARFWGDTAMTWLYDLHFSLLAGDTGRTVVGVGGLLALVSLGSGLSLWWPRSAAQWRQAWWRKPGAGRVRQVWDLHRLAGVYGFGLLLLLSLTGAVLALPTWVDPALAALRPPPEMPRPQSNPPTTSTPGPTRISLDDALAAGQARFPGGQIRWVDTPSGPTGTWRLRLQQPGEPSERFPHTLVWIDAYQARVLAVHDVSHQHGVDSVMAWVHPLHNGEAFGHAGRIIVLLSGLLMPLLFVTGLMRWRDRQRGQAARRRQRVARQP